MRGASEGEKRIVWWSGRDTDSTVTASNSHLGVSGAYPVRVADCGDGFSSSAIRNVPVSAGSSLQPIVQVLCSTLNAVCFSY